MNSVWIIESRSTTWKGAKWFPDGWDEDDIETYSSREAAEAEVACWKIKGTEFRVAEYRRVEP